MLPWILDYFSVTWNYWRPGVVKTGPLVHTPT